ncbi:hypothetical protein CCACVL1_02037 [Corchorus capsularis]|uniref:Uncharacterized protein n=1 Tax=Corchorus capsularis TaxID=210143 RepID=A0A1R3KDP3_COCAP|nr:hypothetical protein CCACVL1_02037 [Corchorus capsularis]
MAPAGPSLPPPLNDKISDLTIGVQTVGRRGFEDDLQDRIVEIILTSTTLKLGF